MFTLLKRLFISPAVSMSYKREDVSKSEFLDIIKSKNSDIAVADTVYEEFLKYYRGVSYHPHPDDDVFVELKMLDDDLDIVCENVFEKIDVKLPNRNESNQYFDDGKSHGSTIKDLIDYVAHFKQQFGIGTFGEKH